MNPCGICPLAGRASNPRSEVVVEVSEPVAFCDTTDEESAILETPAL